MHISLSSLIYSYFDDMLIFMYKGGLVFDLFFFIGTI